MKTTNQQWKISVGLLLSLAAGTVLAVNPDLATNIPCWRDGPGATRQVWTFDSNANPIVPSLKVNQPGNPQATMTLGSGGQGWKTNGGDNLLLVTATLPFVKQISSITTNYDDPDNPDLITSYTTNYGSAYQSQQYGFGQPYSSANPLGSVVGFWDMGGTGNKMELTLPNSGAPTAGTFRFFLIQVSYLQDVSPTFTATPDTFSSTNNAGGAGTLLNGFTTSNLVEQPLFINGTLANDSSVNYRVVLRHTAATAAGNDTVTISRAGGPVWIDSVIVETLDRSAAGDSLGNIPNATTNIPFAALLANDRGGDFLTAVGGAVNGTVTTNAGNVVQFIPSGLGAASFFYTNRDCMGLITRSAQVTMNVANANTPPVANPDNYTRPKGASLKLKLSDLLTNDTDVDLNALTLTGISPTTTNGVTLFTNGNLLTYTNSATLDANDRFTYTISDGQGGTATGTVTLTVTGGTSGQTSGSLTVSGGVVNLVFHGIPGVAYQVQRSTNAGSSWNTFTNVTARSTTPIGQITVADPFNGVSPIPASAMYRLFLP